MASTNKIQDITLPLNINNIKIKYEFKIPFFQINNNFDVKFINLFVQQKGYEIVNDVRLYLTEESDKDYFLQRSEQFCFELTVGYIIKEMMKNI